jgi:hypothetical protein
MEREMGSSAFGEKFKTITVDYAEKITMPKKFRRVRNRNSDSGMIRHSFCQSKLYRSQLRCNDFSREFVRAGMHPTPDLSPATSNKGNRTPLFTATERIMPPSGRFGQHETEASAFD